MIILKINFLGEFRLYDYGRSANKVLYGTEGPPKYPLGKISVPTALLYGPKDIFATEKVKKLV